MDESSSTELPNDSHREGRAESSQDDHPDSEQLEDLVQMAEHLLQISEDANRHTLAGKAYSFRFMQHGNMDDFNQSLHHYNRAVEMTPEGHPEKFVRHSSLGNSLRTRFERLGGIDDLNQSLHHYNLAVDLALEDHPDKPSLHNNLGTSFLTRFKRLGDIDDLHQSLHHYNHAVELTPDGHRDKPSWHNNMGNSFLTRFERLGNMDDLDQSLRHYNRAVDLTPEGQRHKPSLHSNLGNSFLTRYERLRDIDDLNQSHHHHSCAVELTPEDHPHKPSLYNNFGRSFQIRFERLGDIDDLHQSIHYLNRAVDLTPKGHSDKASHHNNLGTSFLARFERLGDIDDLRQSIHHHNLAVELTPEDHPHKPVWHNSLGNSFVNRFQRLGNTDDINHSIHHHTRAVELMPDDHPNKPMYHNNLGFSFRARFERLGNVEDLRQLIRHHIRAVELTPDGHPQKPFRHNNLGASFLARFDRLGDIDDLNQSLKHHTRAVNLTPEGDPTKPLCHNSLGSSFRTRFQRLGNIDDLNQSIHHHNRAVELTPQRHPDKPSRHNNLGTSFLTRFDRLGDIDDLRQSIHHHNLALGLTPVGHPHKPSGHTNLGRSFRTRFERLGDIDDLHQSVYHHNRAVELTPEGHPDKPLVHNNLANSLRICFERLGNIEHLHQSIHHHTCAVELIPEDHPDKAMHHNNLGNSFLGRFRQLGNTDDLFQALGHSNWAVELTPEGHHAKPLYHNGFGIALFVHFQRFGNIVYCDLSVTQYQNALDIASSTYPNSLGFLLNFSSLLSSRSHAGDLITAIFLCMSAARQDYWSPRMCFRVARAWANYLHELHGQLVPSAFNSYEAVIRELPRMSYIGVPISTRFHELLQVTAIGSDAAAAALCAGKSEVSLEWLEQSRSVVWAQILQMRTPLDNLLESYPDLGARLSQIWAELDLEDSSLPFERRIELARLFEHLLIQIRHKPGFSRFLLPRGYSELQMAAHSGPIVILNASQYKCDAFILLPSQSSPQVIPLHDCDLFRLRAIQHLFRQAASGSTFRPDRIERAFGPGPSVPTRNEMFRMILDFLWSSVVQPCMETLSQLTPPDEPGLIHVRWCPTGPFTFLPLHAATKFGDDGEVLSRLSDTVVSSYIPTISSLLEPKRKSTSAIDCKVLAVLQAATPGQARLFSVGTELEKITQRASEANIVFNTLYGTEATVDEVLKAVPEYSVVHFACHGVQDLQDPLKSGLILHDDRLTLSKMMHTKLPNAQLAFLSACETAMGEEDYPDEAVHIAAGMLAAGFRDVIATMWSIQDSAAPTIADLVYAEIFKDGKLVVDRIPSALHRAVEHLRSRNPNNFMAWMPFIHMGP